MSVAPTLGPDVLVSTDPATLRPVGQVPATDPDAVAEAVAEASSVQRAWAARPVADRAALLRAVAREIVVDDLALARTIVDETGKPIVEAYTHDLFVAVETLDWLARSLEGVLAPRRVPSRQPILLHKRGRVRYSPLGVVGIVSPWNFPIGLPLSQAATAVAAGNAVVLKPSELTPLSGALVEELFVRAGAPSGLVRVVQGPGATVGDALATQQGVDALVFTGSTATGRLVARRAAERLCPITLELGGKDPMIVLADADLERAVEGALWGSFANCGQVCSGVERAYVAHSLVEPFVDRLAERAAGLRIGDGHDPNVDLGPLVTERQRASVEALVADAVEHGSVVVTGGGRPAVGLPGWFHEPTVLLGEPEAARLTREEVFGPVVTVVGVADEAEAVERANASPFALGASVWTRDRRRGHAVGSQLRAGSVWLNDHAYSYGAAQAPWGGRDASGLGRTHGREGLVALSHLTYTDADGGRLTPGWWYPYTDDLLGGFRGVLGGLYGSGTRARLAALSDQRRGVAHLVRKALS